MCAMEAIDCSTVASVGEPTLTRNVCRVQCCDVLLRDPRPDLRFACVNALVAECWLLTFCGLGADSDPWPGPGLSVPH